MESHDRTSPDGTRQGDFKNCIYYFKRYDTDQINKICLILKKILNSMILISFILIYTMNRVSLGHIKSHVI